MTPILAHTWHYNILQIRSPSPSPVFSNQVLGMGMGARLSLHYSHACIPEVLVYLFKSEHQSMLRPSEVHTCKCYVHLMSIDARFVLRLWGLMILCVLHTWWQNNTCLHVCTTVTFVVSKCSLYLNYLQRDEELSFPLIPRIRPKVPKEQ